MRLVGTLNNQKHVKTFSFFLNKKGIEHSFEPVNGDLDRQELWIENEDRIPQALEFLEKFKEDPENEEFSEYFSHVEQVKEDIIKKVRQQRARNFRFRMEVVPQTQFSGKVSTLLLGLTLLFYVWIAFFPVKNPSETTSVYNASPVFENFLFDYPSQSEARDQFYELYGKTPTSELPEEGLYLLKKWQEGKEWQGFYPAAIEYFKTGSAPSLDAPSFEKISQGELWRTVTPAFIHYFFLHLFFNVLWFIMLSNQMEYRLGPFRFALFVFIAAVFSNTCQYLMSGAAFMGLSGVICAMITFVYIRSKNAPWEGYLFAPSAFYFISFFILALAGIQLLSFGLEVTEITKFEAGIANTAHLSGAFAGFVLAKLPLFSRFR